MSERRRLMVSYLKRLDELSPLGYNAGLHIRFARPLYFRSTYSDAWQEEYARCQYALRDPLVFWGISKTGRVRWSEIALPDPFGVMEKARGYGLLFGAVVSCGKLTSRTIIGISRDDREFTDVEMDDVAEITEGLHQVAEPPAYLAANEHDALRMMDILDDVSRAASKIGITEDALQARLSSAQARLGASTTAEAIRLAKDYRLI